jgi:hypothetical protein
VLLVVNTGWILGYAGRRLKKFGHSRSLGYVMIFGLLAMHDNNETSVFLLHDECFKLKVSLRVLRSTAEFRNRIKVTK